MEPILLIERTVSDPVGENAQTGESGLNVVFVVAFAVFISYLALRISRKGRRK